MKYSVLVFDSCIPDLCEQDTPALEFQGLSWADACTLCSLAFPQGYKAVIWMPDESASSNGGDDEQPEEALPKKEL